MGLKSVAKTLLPRPVIRAIRRVFPAQYDPFAPFTISEDATIAAKRRYADIAWPDRAGGRAIYALTPTAELKNVGDQAQVVAIKRWLAKHYPDRSIVELDKDVVIACKKELRAEIGPDDLIFLHSGGNLGDRGRWSETARRTMIETFPGNRILSLPQTIYFSDTPTGRHEQAISERIYNAHPDLTVLGRDKVSGQLAAKLFPKARTDTMPDFVLSLDADEFGVKRDAVDAGKVMACLRVDDESVFTAEERLKVADGIGKPMTLFDTTLDELIPADRREPVLRETLDLFARHGSVVTDRYHGLIFAVICRKPTVVLRTVDHKLTSAMEWFVDIPNVRFCEDPADIPRLLAEVEATPVARYPDFNALYFDRLPDLFAQGRLSSTTRAA